MRHFRFVLATGSLAFAWIALARTPVASITAPMAFEPNHGQAPCDAEFIARGPNYLIQIQKRKVWLAGITSSPIHLEMELEGAEPSGATGRDPLPGRSHYLVGNQSADHVRDIPHFGKVEVRQAYPGIDVIYHGNQKRLEYDFVVEPGGQPERIRLRFRGQTGLEISREGDLVLRFGEAEWRQPKPILYQLPDRSPVDGGFVLAQDGTVGFSVASWDRKRTLVIDPVLTFATYLGGGGNDQAEAVAVDASGNIYVSGTTRSVNFPLAGAYQGTLKNSGDAFVTKFNSTGTSVVYSTYLGGANAAVDEHAYGIAVDSSGRAWITGETWSSDFPTIASPLNGTCSASAFLSRLSAAGNSLDFSICIPGTRIGRSVRLDAALNVYVSGQASSGLPVVNAAQPSPGTSTDGFVGKLNAAATAWQYMTYLAGNSIDDVKAMAVDSAGNACVTGSTWSDNLPMVNARQAASAGGIDAFVFKYNSAGAIVFSTYLGGTGADDGRSVAIDSLGNCYVTGSTASAGSNFPLQNAAQSVAGGNSDAFVTAYSGSGTAYLYSTYLGGAFNDVGQAIVVGPAGVAHVTGDTASANFPVLHPIQSQIKDYGSAWISTNTGGSFARSALSNVSVTSIAVDPTNAQKLYAGTTEGIYRSVDGGASWIRSDSGWSYTRIVTLAVDPTAPCTIYAGIDIFRNDVNSTGALTRSLDCGVSWGIPVSSGFARQVFSISLSAASPPVVYYTQERNLTLTTTQRSVARSTPTGVEYSYPGPGGYYRVATDPANGCTSYATETVGTVYKNTSCAAWNWSTIGSGLGWLVAIAVHPSNQATVIVGNDAGGLYRKLDAATPFQIVATLNGEVTSIVYHRDNAQIVYASSRAGGIYKSTDGGGSWALVASLNEVSGLATTAAAANNLYAGTAANTDLFYTRLSPTGAIIDSTFLGGRGNDSAKGMALDSDGSAVIAGSTTATDFPATAGVARTSSGGASDAFLVKIGGATPCTYSLNPTSAAPTAAGGPASLTVTAPGGCAWSAVSNNNWITIAGASSGSGDGAVNYSVSANSVATQRTGSITIAGQTFSIVQAGLAPAYRIGIVRNAAWFLDSNGNGRFENGIDRAFDWWGGVGSIPVRGDWNGSGPTKAGFYKDGLWYLDYDGNGVFTATDKVYGFGWAAAGITPLVGDWNGDGRSKVAVFYSGFWYLDYNGNGIWDGPVTDRVYSWGWNGVTPVVGDWNGDGRAKIGFFVNGLWYLDHNGNGAWEGAATDRLYGWGWNGVTPLVGDWNGDGRKKIGFFINGFWYLDYNGDGVWDNGVIDKIYSFGWSGVTPLVADWNGDGRDKIGIFINGIWYLDVIGNGVGGTAVAAGYGQAGDLPITGRW